MSPEGPVKLPRFLIRQPLLDAHYHVAGYEFGLSDHVPLAVLPGAANPEQARDEHLIASIADLAYHDALGGYLTVLDLAEASLTNPMLAQLPSGKIAVPLSAGLDQLADRAADLGRFGLLALVDASGDVPAGLPDGCQWVRLDSRRLTGNDLGEAAWRWRRLGAKRLIAGNVDSEEAFEVCRALAFDLYQGAFLVQPRAQAGRRLYGGIMQVMELLNLATERAPFEQMEAVFKRNAALTYRLLRFINSPANGLGQAMTSIGHALIWLGHEPLYRWLSLLLFSAGEGDGRDAALLANALVRARFMENLGAARLDAGQRGGLFIVGILSHLDALLNIPMRQALEPLKLPETMRAALLDGSGIYASYLRLAQACERFDQEAVAELAHSQGLDADAVNLAHVNALIWSETVAK